MDCGDAEAVVLIGVENEEWCGGGRQAAAQRTARHQQRAHQGAHQRGHRRCAQPLRRQTALRAPLVEPAFILLTNKLAKTHKKRKLNKDKTKWLGPVAKAAVVDAVAYDAASEAVVGAVDSAPCLVAAAAGRGRATRCCHAHLVQIRLRDNFIAKVINS